MFAGSEIQIVFDQIFTGCTGYVRQNKDVGSKAGNLGELTLINFMQFRKKRRGVQDHKEPTK